MILARVVGNLVATAKHPSFDGQKLLLVQPEEPDGESIPLTLHFERQGAVDIDVPLTAPGEIAEGGMHH